MNYKLISQYSCGLLLSIIWFVMAISISFQIELWYELLFVVPLYLIAIMFFTGTYFEKIDIIKEHQPAKV